VTITGPVVEAQIIFLLCYGVSELRLFLAGGSPRDPVVGAATGFQSTLAQIVGALGPWPFVLPLVVAAALWLNRRRREAVRPDRR